MLDQSACDASCFSRFGPAIDAVIRLFSRVHRRFPHAELRELVIWVTGIHSNLTLHSQRPLILRPCVQMGLVQHNSDRPQLSQL